MAIKKIAITTDSNSGVMPTEGNEFGLFTLSMPFIVNGQQYLENMELSPEEFYNLMAQNANISTSQPSVGEVMEFWDKILQEYDEIVHIPTSAALSAANSTATALAEEPAYKGKVFVVDNRRMTITLKETAYDAVKLRDQGLSSEEIRQQLLERMESAIYIAVDTMEYLKKGGRVTPLAASIGSILKLKPILQIQGEKINKHSVVKGSIKAFNAIKDCIVKDLSTRFAQYIESGEVCVSFAYSNGNKDVALQLKEELEKLFPNVVYRYVDPVSLSIACHTGPGVFGASVSRCFNI